ncbi:MAG: NYN domain-containing protein [Saprospiraceae bacterium]|nr:NYN domain-containing protein [Saprospiraceae bacterium]
MSDSTKKLTRIGVFYDGNYFLHVSNYYAYHHERRGRLSIAGLHDFIRYKVAEEESKEMHLCQIVDAHYFRGRLSAQEASNEGNRLFYDRLFDDILMMEGVTTHYLPVRTSFHGQRQERGIDVWMALEAFELALHKQFDVLVLIASDGDFMPLVRKLHTLGVRVMLFAWDYDFYDEEGRRRSTVTSQALWEEVTYPLAMQDVISEDNDPQFPVSRLFVERKRNPLGTAPGEEPVPVGEEGEVKKSTVFSLKDGYGFINYPQTNNLFFHFSFLIDTDFNDLREGDLVEFTLSKNDRGEPIARNVRLIK